MNRVSAQAPVASDPASEQDGGIVERWKGPEIKSGDPTK